MSADCSVALPCPAETSTAPLSKFIAGRCASLTRSDKVPFHVRGESITPVPSRARRSTSPDRQFSGSNRNLFSESAARLEHADSNQSQHVRRQNHLGSLG